jgi:hypothetical protein
MQLTADEAYANFDTTEMGYAIASQDRIWVVFIFDLWSDGSWADYRYNRLYPTAQDAWAYDMSGDVLVWTSRAEAEQAAAELRVRLDYRYEGDPENQPDVYVMNWGDDARYEASIIGRDGYARPRATPKFKGSEAAWAACVEMGARWAEYAASREAGQSRS